VSKQFDAAEFPYGIAGKNRPEYYGEIRARTETSADIYFYGDIVSRKGYRNWEDEAQWPEKVRSLLNGVKDVKNLNIYINSGGGSVYAGMAIYNMLVRHRAHKTVYVDGLAASMASIIALCGDRVIIPDNAWMMIHQPWGWTMGNADDMEKEVAALRAIEEGMLNTYCAKAKPGTTREEMFEIMRAETWLTGSEAAKYFDIEVTTASNAAAWLDSACYQGYKNAPPGFVPIAKKTGQELEEKTPPGNNVALAKAKLKLKAKISRRTLE